MSFLIKDDALPSPRSIFTRELMPDPVRNLLPRRTVQGG